MGRPGSSGSLSFTDVKPLFAANCSGCHNWQDDEAAAVAAAKQGKIQHLVGNKIMPKAPSPQAEKISQGDRDKIVEWAKSVAAGTAGATATPAGGPAPKASPFAIDDKNLSFVNRCMRCHGPQGTSADPQFPNLAGHSHAYIVNRLLEFMQPGARGTIMPGQMTVLKNTYGLKDEKDPDTLALLDFAAEFFGKYNLSVSAEDLSARREKLNDEEKALYETGKKIVIERQCTSCHLAGPERRPLDGMPMIFAQKRGYLESRLSDFKNKLSGQVMPDQVADMDSKDLTAIALYLSLTHPTEAP